jgi:hypothetical protein
VHRAFVAYVVALVLAVGCATPTYRLVQAAYEGDRARATEVMNAGGVDINAEVKLRKYIHRRPLEAALDGGDLEIMRMVIDAGADLDHTGHRAAPILSIALKDRKFDMARLLLERGADPRKVDEDRKTPLHYLLEDACWQARPEDISAMGEALLAAGADPNAVDENEQGVLYPAIACRNEALVAALVRAGIRVDAPKTTLGETPLLYATRKEAHAVMRVLLAAGADPTVKTAAGEDACAIAKANETAGRRNFPMEALAQAGLPCAIEADAAHTAAASAAASRALQERQAAKKAAAAAPPVWNVPKQDDPPPPKKGFWDNFFEGAKNVDTSAYDRATACPQGGVHCGSRCCGSGTICCVADSSSSRTGGVCMAARAGHGCPWGSRQVSH